MLKMYLSLLLVLLMNSCFSQRLDTIRSEKPFYNRGLAMYLVFPKLEMTSFSSLNPLLTENGYTPLPRQTFNWGVGLQYRWGLFLLNVDAMLGHQQRSAMGGETAFRRSVLSTNLNVAYCLHSIEASTAGAVIFYPFTGISTNNNNLFVSRVTQGRAIGQLLEVPQNTLQLEHFALGVNIGIGADITSMRVEGMSLVSLRLGYRFNPEGDYAWESSFTNITDAPSDSFDHFFVQINFGGGFNWKKNA